MSYIKCLLFLVLLFLRFDLLLCHFFLLTVLLTPLEINTVTIKYSFLADFIRSILYSTSASFSQLCCLIFYFCSYFYLYVLGDLTPEEEFQIEVDRSSEKNKKACEAWKSKITFC